MEPERAVGKYLRGKTDCSCYFEEFKDKLSIINLLQKCIEVIGTAFFVAAGIKYFSAYIQANRIIDAPFSLRMEMETPDKPSPE